jgi:hypothetical protein
MRSVVQRLQTWYHAQCDDEWEHSFGVAIETLDNPGWSVRVDLVGTVLADRPFVDVEQLESDETWLRCSVGANEFGDTAGQGCSRRFFGSS